MGYKTESNKLIKQTHRQRQQEGGYQIGRGWGNDEGKGGSNLWCGRKTGLWVVSTQVMYYRT